MLALRVIRASNKLPSFGKLVDKISGSAAWTFSSYLLHYFFSFFISVIKIFFENIGIK